MRISFTLTLIFFITMLIGQTKTGELKNDHSLVKVQNVSKDSVLVQKEEFVKPTRKSETPFEPKTEKQIMILNPNKKD